MVIASSTVICRSSWTKSREVIGKAEILPKGDKPWFYRDQLAHGWLRQSQHVARFEAAALHRKFYCARGDIELLTRASMVLPLK
jgi:hypothetical protein